MTNGVDFTDILHFHIVLHLFYDRIQFCGVGPTPRGVAEARKRSEATMGARAGRVPQGPTTRQVKFETDRENKVNIYPGKSANSSVKSTLNGQK